MTPDDRRADIAASLLGVPARRAETLAAITTILENQNASDALKTKLIATLGENPGPDTDKAMIAALAKTRSTPLFDQVVRRPESTRALLAAMKAGEVTPANLGPGNVARLRTHPNRAVAKGSGRAARHAQPVGQGEGDGDCVAHRGGGEAR